MEFFKGGGGGGGGGSMVKKNVGGGGGGFLPQLNRQFPLEIHKFSPKGGLDMECRE